MKMIKLKPIHRVLVGIYILMLMAHIVWVCKHLKSRLNFRIAPFSRCAKKIHASNESADSKEIKIITQNG